MTLALQRPPPPPRNGPGLRTPPASRSRPPPAQGWAGPVLRRGRRWLREQRRRRVPGAPYPRGSRLRHPHPLTAGWNRRQKRRPPRAHGDLTTAATTPDSSAEFACRADEGKKEGRGKKGLEEGSRAAGSAVWGECARGAAPRCPLGSRSSGSLPYCSPSSPVGPGEFVQPRRTPSASLTGRARPPPGAPSALSLPDRHLELFCSGASQRPAEGAARTCWGLPEDRQVCAGLVRGSIPPAPRPRPAPREKPGEEEDREKSKGNQPAWICLPGTGAALAVCRGERGRSHHAPASLSGRPRPPGWSAAPRPLPGRRRRRVGSRCSRARGAPRCGPELGIPHRREREQPGAEWPVRPAKRDPRAPGFCLVPRLNFPWRD
ncbi:basic salivary proline-rich protein 4-like [Manis pentadactyla]|uniref:basic salivary proline-rich protein 4-like n=1 Tax=Manis pentadactyla TaxID=143292 RepID=UPI00255C3363|nr:basic salivary proline-rich protein 4-like [Manis pentadactyla]